jgi:hypothetical protein
MSQLDESLTLERLVREVTELHQQQEGSLQRTTFLGMTPANKEYEARREKITELLRQIGKLTRT